MKQVELNKYSINFTEDDRIYLYKKQIMDWWVEDAHPEIGVRAEKLVRKLLKKEKKDKLREEKKETVEKEVEQNDE